MFSRFAAGLAVLGLGATALQAYTLTGSHWYSSPITMQLQLGGTTAPLSDGSASWGASAEDALSVWNSYIGSNRFTVVRDSTAPIAQGNRVNNVFFSGDVYGQAWGSGVLAITLTYSTSTSQSTECDVLFNSSLNWDSYRGAQHYSSTGTAIYDFHRVAMHEFGHVLGLDHPDQAGQAVTALMNSRISNLDTVAADDIAGAQSIYGANTSGTTSGGTSSGTTSTTAAAPVITTQPVSQTVAAGSTVNFSVGVSSSTAVTYQWMKNATAISGATGATLTLPNVGPVTSGSYSVYVKNGGGSVTSNSATLTVLAPSTAPTITTQPASQTVATGSSVTFGVGASGTTPISYLWFKNGNAISGATNATYSIGSVQASDAAGYSVRLINSAGSATSNSATLTVIAAPTITAAPTAQTVATGGQILLSVTAASSGTTTYQWQKNGMNIAGATQATYVIATAAPTDAGTYAVVVTNAAGSTTTVPVLVSVNSSQLVNISTRGYVPPGGALTAGFVLRGAASKPVIVRGVGPALGNFGVTDALTDPQLALIAQSSSQTLAVNNSWSDSPQLSTAFQSVGAFPLPSGSADSASELQLIPGSYSTRITSDTTGGGVALAEVYDADPTTVATRLINISTLGYSGGGDNALVAGFSIQGNAPKRVLIRAVGPGLAPYGVTGLLSDPRVDVYQLGQSTALAGNDNWAGSADLSAAFATANAFPLTAGSADAALVLSLAPGSYTAVVTGVNGSTGNVLLEIYDLDP